MSQALEHLPPRLAEQGLSLLGEEEQHRRMTRLVRKMALMNPARRLVCLNRKQAIRLKLAGCQKLDQEHPVLGAQETPLLAETRFQRRMEPHFLQMTGCEHRQILC